MRLADRGRRELVDGVAVSRPHDDWLFCIVISDAAGVFRGAVYDWKTDKPVSICSDRHRRVRAAFRCAIKMRRFLRSIPKKTDQVSP